MQTPRSPIVVPLDGSRAAAAALAYVATVAPPGGDALLLQALPEPHEIRGLLGDILLSTDELLQWSRQGAETELAAGADDLRSRAPHLHVHSLVEVGDPAETIVTVARDRAASLIVMTSYGRGAGTGHAFGSIAHRVAHLATTPVLIVPPAAAEDGVAGIERLVVATDGSDASEGAVPVAQEIAARLDRPLHLVSVVDLAETLVPPLDYGAAIGRDRLAGLLADARRDAHAVVEGHGARLLRAGIGASWEVREGAAAPAILDLLRPGDLLVIGSHGRSSARRWRLGSVAEKLVREACQPVLLLRSLASAIAPAEAGAQRSNEEAW